MDRVIHVVEPTLSGEAGHCRSFVESLCAAARGSGWRLRVWAGRGAARRAGGPADVELTPYFFRRVRRAQALLLYRRLLGEGGRILVSTAGRADLALLALAAGRGGIPAGRVFLYFHWLRPTPGRIASLEKAAARLPAVTVMGPTPSVAATLSSCGFRDVRLAPYPITPDLRGRAGAGRGFAHLLFAGAARSDKGFGRVVDLVALLAARGEEIPVTVQASPDHYDKTDAAARADIERLRAIGYARLRVVDATLGEGDYAALFEGAICLQPYRREDFADRVSGVTLDALTAGCPVLATAGTWMARAAERFDAGAAVADVSAEGLLAAVRAVRDDYGRYGRNAAAAGRALQDELSARHLFAILTGEAA